MFCQRCGASIEGTPSYCPNCGAPVASATAVAAAIPAAGGYGGAVATPGATPAYGGFWRRLAAMFLDGLLLNVVCFPISMMFMIPMTTSMQAMRSEDYSPENLAQFFGVYLMLALVSTVLSWLYCALMMASARQATGGMMALDLIATDLQGRKLSFARASGRYFASIVTSFTIGIGYLLMLFTERRQTLHDLIAGTLIVRKP